MCPQWRVHKLMDTDLHNLMENWKTEGEGKQLRTLRVTSCKPLRKRNSLGKMKITRPRSQHSKLWSWDRPASDRHTFQPCFLHFLAGACLNQSHQGTGQDGCQGHGDLLSRGRGIQTQASRCCLNLSLVQSWASHPFQWGSRRLCSSLRPSFPSGPSQPNASRLSQRG